MKLIGIPADTCWLFPIAKGKINTYSVISDIECPWITHIQKGEFEPIVSLTKENLIIMLGDDKKSTMLAKKGKLPKAIKTYNE